MTPDLLDGPRGEDDLRRATRAEQDNERGTYGSRVKFHAASKDAA